MIPKCVVPDFDEATHTYYVEGKKVPGVSDILKTVGISKDFAGVDPFYRERGIASHKAIEYLLAGVLDESSLDPVCVPYVDGFKKWRELNQGTSLSEVRLYSPTHNYAGTLDLVVFGQGVYDYKCSKDPDIAYEIQGLFYEWLVFENFDVKLPFSVIKLPGTGDYDMLPSTVSGQWTLLDSVMNLYRWRKRKHVQRVSMDGNVSKNR